MWSGSGGNWSGVIDDMAFRRHNQSNVTLKASCSSHLLWYATDRVLFLSLLSDLASFRFMGVVSE
jgi:hypothetical protein